MTNRIARNGIKLIQLFGLSALTLSATMAPPLVRAQTAVSASGSSIQPVASAAGSPAADAASRLKFDAVSIRPGGQSSWSEFLDPLSEMAPPPGGLFSWNVRLSSLINFAYSLRGLPLRLQASQGLPKWAQNEWYTIEARADGNPSRADVREMVRSMLEDRFQFTGHLEKREGDVFLLEVVKPGLGLRPHPEGAPCTLSPSVTDETSYPHAYPSYKGVPPRCGVFNRELSHSGERRLEMLNVTMQQIVDTLALQLPVPVTDHTGLQGHYDAVLEIAPGFLPRNSDPGDEIGAPPLPTALEKQLGLKLNKQKAQVDAFVVDHIGALTPN